MLLDIGYTGSKFSVQKEFGKIIKDSNKRNVFRTDLEDSGQIKLKFDLTVEPIKSYCQDVAKIKELMDLLINNGYLDRGSVLVNHSGSFHYLYTF